MTPRVATPATRPLDALRFTTGGPPQLTALVTDHLRLLGARPEPVPAPPGAEGRVHLSGDGVTPVDARIRWAPPGGELVDEATVQAATGVMAVHGRRHGTPRGLAVDWVSTTTGVLTVQGLLAALLARARGGTVERVTTRADHAALLTVSQYLAAAGATEAEAVEPAPGGPPFTSADGVLFELETLDPGDWAAFWRALDAPADAIRTGWLPFQFRYATGCAPFPPALHRTTRAHGFAAVRRAAATTGVDVCRLHTLAERAAEHDGAAPWALTPLDAGRPHPLARPAPAAAPERPLAGLTVLEAGRRIQAPLAAHLLGLLGADVVRIEPPGGDPLRGMPPTCAGTSARWLALNRGKRAVRIDIKDPADRARLCELAAGADVFLHNWAPGKAAQLGLDAPDLARVNPALVYAYTGGWADRLADAPMGTDFMVQARTGVGEAARPADEPPAPSLLTLLDVLGGLLGAEAVLAGLLLRERSGHGVRVDSSLLGAADTLTAPALRRVAAGEAPRSPAGFRRPLRTADGWVAPADAGAAAAARHDLGRLTTEAALARLHAHGLGATRVTTDLTDPAHDPRLPGAISRDAHGAPTVVAPWSFA
ncbi:CoA transferase [Streptomyces sp. LE64]|uniref:CoA transferase n=1 Tax=Streptomyces sp. LE64 TaxID=3448653 RepID=UPI0040434E3E